MQEVYHDLLRRRSREEDGEARCQGPRQGEEEEGEAGGEDGRYTLKLFPSVISAVKAKIDGKISQKFC